jgi:hypothetical protein
MRPATRRLRRCGSRQDESREYTARRRLDNIMGYVTGGYFQVNSLDSKGTPENIDQWGAVTNEQMFLGQARRQWWSEGGAFVEIVEGAYLFSTDQAEATGALKVVGGRQLFPSSAQDTFRWGSQTGFEQPVYRSLAYNNSSSSWDPGSRIMLFLVLATDETVEGFRIVGSRQLARDLQSKQPYVTISEWGDTTAREQFLGIGEAYSEEYHWGFSQISLFLAPA